MKKRKSELSGCFEEEGETFRNRNLNILVLGMPFVQKKKKQSSQLSIEIREEGKKKDISYSYIML